ncbi:hypothetical protein BCR34DRAFT_30110 [Clohesyomyces aquaticus]|uniref:Uncharacterized protein n=1 Tax=Clohesyomyces aquaticus TaxID=1231657 RepID=A0A1Y1Z9T2_9PLEO|nr:hypothetical protein BCR34DRAFT_30110 [Clohesyomyces aquaticus]
MSRFEAESMWYRASTLQIEEQTFYQDLLFLTTSYVPRLRVGDQASALERQKRMKQAAIIQNRRLPPLRPLHRLQRPLGVCPSASLPFGSIPFCSLPLHKPTPIHTLHLDIKVGEEGFLVFHPRCRDNFHAGSTHECLDEGFLAMCQVCCTDDMPLG